MIRNPLALRLDPNGPIREQIHEAARLGAKGIVVDAIGDLAPARLGDTGRRDLRHVLRTVELTLAAVSLPTRRPFDTLDQLDERIRRADAAFAMAYELGTAVVLARVGSIPASEDEAKLEVFTNAMRTLGHRAEHRGVRLAMETGTDRGADLKTFLDALDLRGLAVSIDPSSLLQAGIDPVTTTRQLGAWVQHAYAGDSSGLTKSSAPNPRGFGFRPGLLDWEEYVGAFEEIGYHSFLTIWPSPGRPAATDFKAVASRLNAIG
jgi:sugar phosphate isomerase/epimerase